ncbi:hypothetical protein DW078_10425 [Bacteroides fragilis]|nr:hypothetical protein DW078_10425 [Bacteroides fragilis]
MHRSGQRRQLPIQFGFSSTVNPPYFNLITAVVSILPALDTLNRYPFFFKLLAALRIEYSLKSLMLISITSFTDMLANVPINDFLVTKFVVSII